MKNKDYIKDKSSASEVKKFSGNFEHAFNEGGVGVISQTFAAMEPSGLEVYPSDLAIFLPEVNDFQSVAMSPFILDIEMIKSLQAKVRVLEERMSALEYSKSLQTKIYDLGDGNYRLKQPIDVFIKYESDEVLAIIPELELCASGVNEIEVLREIKYEILDLYDDLVEAPDETLGASPKSWKTILKLLIAKND